MNLKRNKTIFIFAGEQSGDLHGSHLISRLKTRNSEWAFEGVCGCRMRSQGMNQVLPMEDFEVMGFTDVVCALPRIYKNFHKILNHILATSPVAVVLIDYASFNLRMAKALRNKGYLGKIIQYISPSVWAWGKDRIKTMAETLDLLLTIYPFESSFFENSTLNAVYVGNPIKEYIYNYNYDDKWQTKLDLPSTKNLIALFPGSRGHEIERNLPLLVNAACRLKEEQPDAIFGVSCSHAITANCLYKSLQVKSNFLKNGFFKIPKQYTYELMRDSRSAAAKSGTITLELALHKRPTVAIYKLAALNRLYAKYILNLKLPHYCIVNILAKQQVFPELIEHGLSVDSLYNHMKILNMEGQERKSCIKGCVQISHLLGKSNASNFAADSIEGLL